MSPIDLSAIAPSITHRIRARHQPLLGGLLVKEGLINQAQLERVLALQQEIEPRPLLGQLLLDQKLVTPHELNAVLSKYNREHLLGDVLVETNLITTAQLETALAAQRRTDGPLGEILIQLGFITERQLKHALSIQLRIAFVDLDQRTIDPALASLISESYARHHQVMPIARAADRIVLAMADPTDVERVTELRSCTGCGIDVVTATTDALERALSRAYGARGEASSGAPPQIEMGEPTGDASTQRPAVSPAPDRESDDLAAKLAPARTGGESPAPKSALTTVRARMEPIRQLARHWERWADSVEGLLGERLERRGQVARLAVELEESRAAHARTKLKLEAKDQALTRLEAAHAALAQEHETLRGLVAELQERQDALLRDRRYAIDHLEAALQRLRA
jgi:hypothetical protein